MLEWGLNWCVSAHCHQYLIFHAAVVEKSGRALILPAPPGSGKSTLCAGLVNRGWRLLSDELTLIDIGVVRRRAAAASGEPQERLDRRHPRLCADGAIGPPVHDTTKGSVAHMRAPTDSVRRATETARPGWIVLPRYEAGVAARLTPLSKGTRAHADGGQRVQLQRSWPAWIRMFWRSSSTSASCYEFAYGDLEEAAAVFNDLAART